MTPTRAATMCILVVGIQSSSACRCWSRRPPWPTPYRRSMISFRTLGITCCLGHYLISFPTWRGTAPLNSPVGVLPIVASFLHPLRAATLGFRRRTPCSSSRYASAASMLSTGSGSARNLLLRLVVTTIPAGKALRQGKGSGCYDAANGLFYDCAPCLACPTTASCELRSFCKTDWCSARLAAPSIAACTSS